MEFLHAVLVVLSIGSPPPLAMPVDSVTLTLRGPDTVAPAVTVPLTLVVENAGAEAAAVYLTGRPTAVDLVVEDAQGRVVWRRLEGEVVSQVLQVLRLEPGDRREFAVEWDQRDAEGRAVPPGLYRLRGILLTEGGESWTTTAHVLRIEGGRTRGGGPTFGG